MLQTLRCKHCGGDMETRSIARYGSLWGIIVGGIGFILFISVIAAIIGLPMLLISAYLVLKRDKFWVCKQCYVKIPKTEY